MQRIRKLPGLAVCTAGDNVVPHDGDVTPMDDIDRGPSAAEVGRAIRSGKYPGDRVFDRFLPYDLRLVSGQHWTPLVVAQRVAKWLDLVGIRNVVDLGSGAGKFCVAAAIASRCSFTGIEQRPRFVQAARGLAHVFGVENRVEFLHGALSRDTIPTADAYYLYNPFEENLLGSDEQLGEEVELSPERYQREIAFIEGFFEEAPVGTYVIKYNGFGGRMPLSYEEVHVDREMPNVLRLWRKGGALER
jgi:SAM-dependent methyltransferase